MKRSQPLEYQKTPEEYQRIGKGYSHRRQPDPRIANQIWRALGDADTVCNIGAGTGSYEPLDRQITAVEPSQVMIDKRTTEAPVVRCSAENLPFEDQQFDAAMAVLTVHHWQDPHKGLTEMKRISNRQVVFTFDINFKNSLWLVEDYLPEIMELENTRSLSIQAIAESLAADRIETVPIPWDCIDGFQAAYWRRPEQYLLPDVRASISTLAQLPSKIVDRALGKLAKDISSGDWEKRYAKLLSKEEADFGYKLIICDGE